MPHSDIFGVSDYQTFTLSKKAFITTKKGGVFIYIFHTASASHVCFHCKKNLPCGDKKNDQK
jgi:hypothetical protein